MGKFLGSTALEHLWEQIRAVFATKTELAAKPTGRIYYGTCTTTASVAAKVATVETFPLDANNKPLVGTVVAIKFSTTNTFKTEGTTHTLTVNQTGAYPIYYNNAELVSTTSANTLAAGYKNRHVFYMFNGTQWVWLSASYDTNSTYSAMTQAEIDAGTSTTGRTMTPARLRDNFYTETECNTNFATAVSYDSNSKKIQYTKNSTATDVVTLASVATSGSYNDLSNTPSVGDTNVIETVKVNGTALTPDANKAVDVTVPTKVSDLQNDSGFTTNTGTITSVKMNGSTISSSGEADLGTVITSHQSLTNYVQKSNTAGLLKNDGTVDTSTYLTSAPVTSVNNQTGAVTLAIPSATSTTPAMDGTAAVGSESTFAKGDHVHPSDTSREARVTTVSHGTSDTTFTLTPNVLHTWGTINSLTLTLGTGSSTYVDGYWFKFTAGSSFTALTMPSGVSWVSEPQIASGKTYEVMIVDNLASYVTDDIGDEVKARTKIVNHGTSDTTYQLPPNELHIWGEVASLSLTLQSEATGFVSGYWFRFTSGSTATTLTLPSSVQWYYDNGFTPEANKTYEVTIVDGYACYTDYSDATHVATKLWVENNIKTVNGTSLIGTGDVTISAGGTTASAVSGSTLTAAVNTIYTYSSAVTSLAVTLPAMSDATKAEAISIFLTTGTSPTITFSSADSKTIYYHDGYALEDSTMYELNALFNGVAWVVGMCKITTS